MFLRGRGATETGVTAAQRSIRNAAGRELLRAPSGGPMIFLSLPDGDYTVTARFEGTTRSRVVSVHAGMDAAVLLEWSPSLQVRA
jgi:hypothetical protein